MKVLNPELIKFSTALVLIPHPDDEAIGCGALLSLLASSGCQIEVILVSNGDGAGELPAGTSEARIVELLNSLTQLGLNCKPTLWMEPDGGLTESPSLPRRVAECLNNTEAELIIAPWEGDQHPDHAAVGKLVGEWQRSTKPGSTVLFFEVWTPLPANSVVDATSVWAKKCAALSAHKTALACGDYMHAMTGLAAYRSLFLPHTQERSRYAEAYLQIERGVPTTASVSSETLLSRIKGFFSG